MKFRRSAHALYKTEYHLVWIPRYRRKIFVKGVKEYARRFFARIPGLEPGIEVVRVNVQEDHVHAVIVIPPRLAVADVVKYIKMQSAKVLAAKFPFLKKVYRGQDGIWSRGYCVTSLGMNEKEILQYVDYQHKDDSGQLRLPF